MSKKRHKAPPPQKVTEAHLRNVYMDRLKAFCDLVAGQEVFRLLPEKARDRLYRIRFHPGRVITIGEIPSAVVKEVKWFILNLLKVEKLPFTLDGQLLDISLYEYFTTGLTVITYAMNLKEHEYDQAMEVKQLLEPAIQALGSDDMYQKALHLYFSVMNTAALTCSDLRESLYTVRHALKNNMGGIPGVYYCAVIHRFHTEQVGVTLDDKTRPALRLGWALPEPEAHLKFIEVDPQKTGLKGTKPLGVFIQSHAFDRLQERIDGFDPGLLHFNLYDTFLNPKIHRDDNGRLLFEYRIFGNKVGYFRGDLADGRIILRTFLFLTNNGTPEGKKLHKNTGLMKEDKMFLAIDKLSTFVTSDIVKNEHIRDIFIKAGCESILGINKGLSLFPEDYKEQQLAGLIGSYLNTSRSHSLGDVLKDTGHGDH